MRGTEVGEGRSTSGGQREERGGVCIFVKSED